MRFPEFDGEWEICKISDVLEFFPTNSLSWDQLEYETDNINNLHYGLIHRGLPTQIESNKCSLPNIRDEFVPNNYTLCNDGDVAFADASEDTNDVGKVVEFLSCESNHIVCGLHTIHGRDKKNLTIKGFKGYAFSSEIFRHQIRRLAQGTKIYSISPKNFHEVYIGIPSKEEQTKIATLLRLIDERIATQNKIIEDLKKLKTALVDKLYHSRLRFSEFDKPWIKTTLGDITNNFNRRNKEKNIYPMYSVTNDKGFVKQSDKFGDREMVGEDIGSYKIVNSGEFAYNPARINVGSIARYNDSMPCMISSLYVCFSLRSEIDSDWALFLLKSKRLNFYYDVYGEGGVRVYLFYPNFSRIKISVPEYKEQMKIGKFIFVINEHINIETTLASKYQQQKAYILNELFI